MRKVIVLLGPPSSMDVALKRTRTGGRTTSMNAATSSGSARTGASLGDVAEVNQRDAMSAAAASDKVYTIAYTAEQLPTKKPLTIVIDVENRVIETTADLASRPSRPWPVSSEATGAFAKYAALVGSASHGAVTLPG